MECALSGGFPLTRLKKSDLIQWEQSVLHTLTHETPVDMGRLTPLRHPEHGFAVADHPGAMEYAAQLQRLGLPAPWDLWLHGRPLQRVPRDRPPRPPSRRQAGSWAISR